MSLHVAGIYTLFGRRAGAELLFEQTVANFLRLFPEVRWTVFCNREAESVLGRTCPGIRRIYVPQLDNQFRKAFWLEFLSRKPVEALAPDVVWIPSGCNYFPGRWSVPTTTTFLDLGEYRVAGKYDFKRTLFRKWICIPRSVRRSTVFTAISRFTADDLARFLGVANVSVVHCGPATHRARRPADGAGLLRAGPGLVPRKFYFVPGRTDYIGKGLDLILAAYERLAAGWPDDVKLVFVGPPGEGHRRFVERLATLDRGRERLKYLGRVEEELLAALYGECLATVLPSRFEGFGFPVLEAMACGAPVLCSDAGSLPEVAGEAALLFRSGDVADLVAKWQRLGADAELRRLLVERGAKQAGCFSWDRSAAGMLAAFRQAVETARAAGARR